MKHRLTASLFASSALVFACSSGTPSNGAPGDYDFVSASAAREARCNDGGALSESDRAELVAAQKCYATALANPVAVERCLTERACDTGDDQCFVDATRSSAAKVTSYNQSCLAKRSTCSSGTSSAFADDYCYVSVFNDSAIDQFSSCLNQPCDAVKDCFKATYAGFGCGK